MGRRTFVTTSATGLQEDSLPFKLFQKAKRLGVWNPAELDFTQDIRDWQTFSDEQKQGILRLIAQFQGGEEAVTRDLLPLMMIIAKEGRLEEEMFLTTFLFEEAKHTEFFRLVLNALGENDDLSHYHDEAYHAIFNQMLPTAMERLVNDHSPEAVAEASTVYNMFVEGVLAETGYYSFYQTLESINAMPALLQGIGYLKRDESRHIAYGTFLLQRLISEHPHIYDIVARKMEQLKPFAIQFNRDELGNENEDTLNYSMRQLMIRMDILSRARNKNMEEIYKQKEDDFGIA
ncbi:R2-like ligand-binding oxidase [Shouchella shacheensis]|uniref:R2-like ligand-binding oxidase n=1 Tax=Shouchella shacheensis TaxID=1649580 RepID=UPI00073FB812|nr:R2-like ligand-binding oxidase [Shouchella shacheensis]